MTARRGTYRPLWVGSLAVAVLPLAMLACGLTVDTAAVVVIFAIAAMGLNLLVGYTGLTSFGQATWFGIGSYAAALAQLHWFADQMFAPILFAAGAVAVLASVVGVLILRRRGVYFALLTLALSALTYTIAFRWTEVTGGENGLGGLQRGAVGPVSFDEPVVFYALVGAIGVATLQVLLRVIRSPFGHVLVAIRENDQRATFQGHNVNRYKLAAYVLSAVVTGVAGALLAFHHYLVSADATSVPFSGELLAMVVIGGMRDLLGPALGALFYILFRELFSMWTSDWLLWFGLLFIAFVMYSPSGLVGVWARLRRRTAEATAATGHPSEHSLPLPGFLCRPARDGTVLDARGLSKQFGGIQAVSGASLEIRSGEVHALIGPNGAGKTTVFNLISGLFPTDQGTVRLGGNDVHRRATHEICRLGLARSFQITSLFRGLSVYENLRLSLQASDPRWNRLSPWRDIDSYPEIHARTAELIRYLGLEDIADVEAGLLSYGGQRLVDLGIALGLQPQVLLLDEPLAGLAAAQRERVANLVRSVAAHVPVLIVEHDIDRVLGLSHRVTVMNEGEVLITGSPDEVRGSRRVQEIYTGTGASLVTRREVPEAGDTGDRPQLLVVEAVNAFYGKSHILNDASLDVREGEIVALVGRNGAGKSTLLKTLAGLVPPASGRIQYDGRAIAGLPAPDIARLGIGYVPQGRGLFAGMTVAENLKLGRLARPTAGRDGIVWSEQQIFEYFPRLKQRMNVAADYLSGGEQQMAAVARALSGHVKLLLLDEPFEGLAPVIVQELVKVLDRLRRQVSIVIVEHNLDMVLALADRVFALERGAVIHHGPAAPLATDLEYRKRILWL
jgi:ABC-type branched-subunit amino acid transport system ATPase component/ABC-type branched-subunit amino acid transport system permease subunit